MHPQWACTLRENRLRRHLEEGDDLRALSAATAASARLPARCQPSCSGGGQIGGGRRGRVRPALAGRTAAARELLGALIAHSSDDHQRVLRVPQQLHRSGWCQHAASGMAKACRRVRTSRRRDCHFDDTPFLSLLKNLLKVERGAAE